MDFYRIEYFLMLAKTLNYVEAAKQLYISPQALSKQIMLLEDELGEKLFDRTTRSVKLTEFGLICYSRFSKVKKEYDNAVNDIQNIIQQKQKTMRIGFLSALPKNEVITPILELASETCPKLNFEIVAEDMDKVKDLLESDQIDFCITNVHEFEKWDNCTVIKLATVPAKIVVSLYHPWVMKEKITEKDMEEGEIIKYRRGMSHEPDSFYNKVKCKNVHYVNNFDSMLASLEIGKYYGVFPKVFDYMYKAKFKYFDLPDKYKFDYYTCAICKNEKNNEHIKNIFTNLAEELNVAQLLYH